MGEEKKMTDHKTVREALKIGQDLAKKEVNLYVQNGWDAAPAIIDKKNICEALAALDRIEAVETVTPSDISEHIKNWRFSDDYECDFGSYLSLKYPNGLITKEKQP